MSDYNQYVTAVNKIFDYLAKMKAGWSSQDNKNYIESIEEYKQTVIRSAEELKKAAPSKPVEKLEEDEDLEALGDD